MFLEYQAGFPTETTVEKLYDEMDFQRAVLAHQYADKLVSYDGMNVGFQSVGAREGDLIIFERFLDPRGLVLTGNDTTIYGLSFLDLDEDGPMVIEVEAGNVYGQFFDLWQVPLGPITREGGTFVVAPDGFDGTLPEGARLLHSRTTLAALFIRGLVVNDDVEGAANSLKRIKVYPLSESAAPQPTKVVLASGKVMDTLSPQGMAFWGRLAKLVDKIPADDDGSLLLSFLKPLGIEQGKPFRPDVRQTKILEDAAQFAWLMEQAISMAPRFEDVIYYPGTHWEWVLVLDPSLRSSFWRDLEARTNYYFQATMAVPEMRNKAIGVGSQYVRAARDASGEWLDGSNLYRLRVPTDPPVKLFWSVTVHDYETRSQIQTDTNHAALSSYDELQMNTDGSVDLYFGPTAPERMESNWVKTIPSRGWWVWFRFYSPTEAFFDKSYQLPDFERIQ